MVAASCCTNPVAPAIEHRGRRYTLVLSASGRGLGPGGSVVRNSALRQMGAAAVSCRDPHRPKSRRVTGGSLQIIGSLLIFVSQLIACNGLGVPPIVERVPLDRFVLGTGAATQLAMSADEQRILCLEHVHGRDDRLHILDADLDELGWLPVDGAWGVCVSEDGGRIATNSRQGLRVYDSADLTLQAARSDAAFLFERILQSVGPAWWLSDDRHRILILGEDLSETGRVDFDQSQWIKTARDAKSGTILVGFGKDLRKVSESGTFLGDPVRLPLSGQILSIFAGGGIAIVSSSEDELLSIDVRTMTVRSRKRLPPVMFALGPSGRYAAIVHWQPAESGAGKQQFVWEVYDTTTMPPLVVATLKYQSDSLVDGLLVLDGAESVVFTQGGHLLRWRFRQGSSGP